MPPESHTEKGRERADFPRTGREPGMGAPNHILKAEAARFLYKQGQTLATIARLVGCGVRSVSRWKGKDAGTEFDWNVLRDGSRASCPAAIVAVLEHRIVRTAEDDTLSPGARGYEVRELYAVLVAERKYAERKLGQAGQEDGANAIEEINNEDSRASR